MPVEYQFNLMTKEVASCAPGALMMLSALLQVCTHYLACCLQQAVAQSGQRCSSSKEEAEDCHYDQKNAVQGR